MLQILFTVAFALVILLYFPVSWASLTPLRLTGGSGPHEGNVEVFIDGEWRYICDDKWDIRDAKVVCRSLNYAKGLEAHHKSHFKITSNVSYWLDNVQCWGSEKDITYCWHKKSPKHDCAHLQEVAGVTCSDEHDNVETTPSMQFLPNDIDTQPEVRLQGKPIHGFVSSGWLQVKYKDIWGSVCMDDWTDTNSFVACGHLGYPDIDDSENFEEILSNEIIETYWMKDVKCHGTESTIFECQHSGWERYSCQNPVFLSCKRSPMVREYRFDKESIKNHDIRLRSGSSHSEGRVEILHMGRWGTFCDDGWSIKNANVFCRQMGFGTAYEAVHNGGFGQAIGKIWLDQVSCIGSEEDVRECKHLEWGEGDCGHAEDAGVKCHFPYTEVAEKIRLVGGPHKRIGRVEIYRDGEWMGLCGRKWSVREAEVVCRQLKLGYGYRGYSSAEYGMPKKRTEFGVRCSGDELAIQYCIEADSKKRDCPSYEIAAVECSETAPDVVMDYRELKRSMRVESRSLYDLSCAYEENCLSKSASSYVHYPNLFSRTLLRFTSRYWNRGTAAFIPFKEKSAWQWHQCHAHYHSMERFSDYDLTDANHKKVAEGHKASFCLEDSKCEKGVSKFFNCSGGGDQGVSVNCADNYKWNIDCQWIDATDVKYGKYRLRVVINPLRRVIESDYSNNIAFCDIDFISQSKVNVTHCQLEPCEQLSYGGTSGGACCKFPFIYKRKEYHACTTDGFGDTLWCSTTTNYKKDKLWGFC